MVRFSKGDSSITQLHEAYPFHSLFFRNTAIAAFRQRRAITLALDRGLYPTLARIIAQERYRDVHLNHTFRGMIDGAMADMIDRIVTELRVKQRRPDHAQETAAVLQARGGEPRQVVTTADLYIGDFSSGPFFAELKAPLPNLDIAAESKHKMLTFIALHKDRQAQAFLAFPYNPFITRAAYKHPFTSQVMDISAEVLMGEEFWNKIGGDGTFCEVMDIIEEVTRRTSLSAGAGRAGEQSTSNPPEGSRP